jgi:hypothetical protein
MKEIVRDLSDIMMYIDLSARVDCVEKLLDLLSPIIMSIPEEELEKDFVKQLFATVLAIESVLEDNEEQVAAFNLPDAIDIIEGAEDQDLIICDYTDEDGDIKEEIKEPIKVDKEDNVLKVEKWFNDKEQ